MASDPSGKAIDLGGARVRINGQYTPVLSVNPYQVQFLCPALEPNTVLEVVVETAGGATNPVSTTMQSASPRLFSLDAAAQSQAARGRLRLLEDGYWGVTEWVGEVAAQVPGGDGAALGGMLNYFAAHQTRLNYALRLRHGQSVGSGLVEGSIKQLLNKRVKQTGARWKVAQVGPFVELGALAAGPEWQAYWERN